MSKLIIPAYEVTPPKTASQKKTQTVMDTILVTPEICKSWVAPPFQRPVRENEKVRALARELTRDGGVWPGVVTLGILDAITYLLDGQHRRAAFLMANISEGYTDVRVHYCADFADMGREFVRLNSALVRNRPDDILRALEHGLEPLQIIRQQTPWVGYDGFRRTPKSPILSMAMMLRSWKCASADAPALYGAATETIACGFGVEEAQGLCEFLTVAYEAWGREPEYQVLWGQINMVICMWLYRNMVLYFETSGFQ